MSAAIDSIPPAGADSRGEPAEPRLHHLVCRLDAYDVQSAVDIAVRNGKARDIRQGLVCRLSPQRCTRGRPAFGHPVRSISDDDIPVGNGKPGGAQLNRNLRILGQIDIAADTS